MTALCLIPAVPTDPGVTCSQTNPVRPGDDRCVSSPVVHLNPAETRFPTSVTEPRNVRSVLIPAGHKIEKQPFGERSWSRTGNQPNAVTTESNPHRQLRPKIPTATAPRLNSCSGRFAIKLSAFSDVRNAHVAAGHWVLDERQFMAELGHLTISIGYLCWNTRSRPKSVAELSKMEVRFG